MKNANFQELYRQSYSALGFKLTDSDEISDSAMAAAERKIGSRIPKALRDYYVVAGRETTLNTAFNRLLPPEEWEIHDGILTFMKKDQGAMVWGVHAKTGGVKNPKVFQGRIVDGKPGAWVEEHRSCSRFLVFMLHLQFAYGKGIPHRASASVPQAMVTALDASWFFIGEVAGTRAYNGPGQAICFSKSPDLLNQTGGWRIFAGATDAKALEVMAQKLGIDWDE